MTSGFFGFILGFFVFKILLVEYYILSEVNITKPVTGTYKKEYAMNMK